MIAIAAVKRFVFAGDADAVLPFARFVCRKTSGGCLVTASYGSAPTAAPSMGLATSENHEWFKLAGFFRDLLKC